MNTQNVSSDWMSAQPQGHLELGRISYTVVQSDTPIAKKFAVQNGAPTKVEGDAVLVSGTAENYSLSGSASDMAAQLAADLETFRSDHVLICAPLPTGPRSRRIVTSAKLDDNPGAISRTQEFFAAPTGLAMMALDFDTKDYPEHIRAKLRALGEDGLFRAMAAAFPALQEAATVIRPSMSSGVRHRENGRVTNGGGLHQYLFVHDGSDISAFAKRLSKRLMLDGWLWGYVSKSGTILLRTLFDIRASSDPSRLFYEGEAILLDHRLELVPEMRKPLAEPGSFLNTQGLAPLSATERSELERLQQAVRFALAEKAEATRRGWASEFNSRARSLLGAPVADEALDRAVREHVLEGAFPIILDDGTSTTARDILADPSAFNKKTCADPLEPEYGGGRNKAIIYSDGAGGVRIESQAHGGTRYRVETSVSDYYEQVEPDRGGWPEPQDVFGFGASSRALEIPKRALPDVIERWAVDTSERMGAPPAFAAVAALATFSAAIGSKLRLQPKLHDPTWTEPASRGSVRQ